MKATGIIRRVDDLGRVVIPREIRRTLGIREGEPLEIFLDGRDTVCFRKYETNLCGEVAFVIVARSRYDRKCYCKKYLFHISLGRFTVRLILGCCRCR